MKKNLILPAIMLLISAFVSAQTLDEVIAKHVEALGGAEKVNSLQSLYLEGVAVLQNGNEITSKIYKVKDKLYRREIELGMGSATILVTDKEGWSSNPRSGGNFEAMPKEVYDAQVTEMDLAGPLIDYAAKGHKAELAGKETIDGSEAYKITVTTKGGREVNYFIDGKTYYIVQQTFKGGGNHGGGGGQPSNNEVIIKFSNYQKTPEGYTLPYTVSMGGGMGASLNYEKIEVNKPVDEKLYKPAK